MFNKNKINVVKIDNLVDGKLKVEERPLFWLPEYKLYFYCENGTAFICNANTTVHMLYNIPKANGCFGDGFLQFCPLVVQLSKALKNHIGKLVKSYFEAKGHYVDEHISCFFKHKYLKFYFM